MKQKPCVGTIANKIEIIKVLFKRRKIDTNGCWNYTGFINDQGYGLYTINYQHYRVSRLSAYLWLGLDISKKEIQSLHKCDNRACFNPDHLFLGSNYDNLLDMMAKG